METRNPDAWSPGKRRLHKKLTMTTPIQPSSTAIKGKKTKDKTERDCKNDWLEMSWAHILMGFGLPAVAAERLLQRSWLPLHAVTELISHHSAWHWTAVQQKPQLVRARWSFWGEPQSGWMGEKPPLQAVGQLPNIVLLQYYAKEPNQPTMPTSETKPTARHAWMKSSLSTAGLKRASRHILAGWALHRYSFTLYINCTLITQSCASKATDQEVFIQEMCTLMLERHLKMQKHRNGCNNSAQISIHSFCLSPIADTWLEKIINLRLQSETSDFNSQLPASSDMGTGWPVSCSDIIILKSSQQIFLSLICLIAFQTVVFLASIMYFIMLHRWMMHYIEMSFLLFVLIFHLIISYKVP